MAIERRLTEIAGPVGGKLHTARSRNDQVATDMALFVRDQATRGAQPAARADAARSPTSPSATRTGRCPATRTSSAPSPSTSRTTCSRTSGCSAATSTGSPTRRARPPTCRSARARWRASTGTRAARSVARELGFDGVVRELARRRLQPRLRARLPERRVDLRHAPVAPRRRDRAVVERGVRLPRARRLVHVGLEPHAAEEEPRRGRAAARQGAAGRRAPRRAARRDARAAARLQQGHAGGQGAPVRRGRHARTSASRRRPGCCARATFDRERLAGAAADEFLAATDIADLLVRRGVPFRESHAIVGGLVRHALDAGQAALRADARGAGRLLRQPRRRVLRGARRTARGSSRRCPRAARPPRACASSSTAPARSSRE